MKRINGRDALRRVRDGKPNTDAEHRVLTGSCLYDQPNFFTAPLLVSALTEPLKRHLEKIQALHQQDLREGFGEVWLPDALAQKYPQAPQRVGLAVCFSSTETFYRAANRQTARNHNPQ